MKKTYFTILTVLMLLVFVNNYSYSQNDNKGKFRAVIKQKLMEKLSISDSVAENYLNLYARNAGEIKKLVKERRDLLKEIENNFDASDMQDKIDRLFAIDLQIDSIKKDFVNELKTFLSPKQIAQSIIFQRNLRTYLQKEIRKKKNQDE